MADFYRQEVTIRRVEYVLASPTNRGEMVKALMTAQADYKRCHDIAEDAHEYDDWLTVETRGDEIVVSFEVKAVSR